jgi:Fe-S cluster assembly scaffold protein SufB
MPNSNLFEALYDSIGLSPHDLRNDPNIAHIEIHHNHVLGVHLVPGLQADAKETKDGIEAKIKVEKNAVIEKPIQICFGMMPETGLQQIVLDMEIEENARAGIFAYCTFPNARNIRHEMDAVLKIGAGAEYSYSERHVHGAGGGVIVAPKSKVHVLEKGRYSTDFELIRGRVGEIDIDVEVIGEAWSVSEVTARISGSGNDRIVIHETAHLVGEGARGVLNSHIALRDTARAEIYNTLTASAPYARGHVDCKEIVQDEAVAKAVPIVEVNHPKAHVTHEAAIGSVDSKQLETLLSRGITEDDAVDLIIQGLLSKPRSVAA